MKCTNCGREYSTRWKFIKEEVLCDKCFSQSHRGITGRTDVEFNTLSIDESVKKMQRSQYG